jgi:hypothetical protein
MCFDERPEARSVCKLLLERLDPDEAVPRLRAFDQLRGQLEAMVLEGNTDMGRFPGAPPITAVSPRSLKDADERWAYRAFVSNTHLGAERARQALGHLAVVVSEAARDLELQRFGVEPLDALFGKITVESSAYGHYLAGPREHRRPGCESARLGICAEARNLSLRLRWSEASLRQPFDAIVAYYCEQLPTGESKYETSDGDRVLCRQRRGAAP